MSAVEHWAKVRREVVLHRMATAAFLDDRLFWGIILWSWCGPESTTGAVVLKDAKGYIRRDNSETPIPAKLKDLRELLGLRPSAKGSITRAVQRLEALNSVHWDKDVLYADSVPAALNPTPPGCSTDNFYIGSRHISTDNLPTDPEARKRAVLWLEKTSTEWNGDLKKLRTRYHQLLEQASPELGILYVLKEKKRKGEEEKNGAPPSPAPVDISKNLSSSSSAFGVPESVKAEEEESRSPYQIFKDEYPADHFDEPKTKPSFEKRTKTQQRHILERLRVYLDCPRWKDSDGQWIPLSSKWLESYDAAPPPLVRKKSNGSATRNALDAFMAGEG